ncbi:uncharacterized protein MELLADRAFT_104029 [Melampsora larici-populina 98AG31]|uniref:Uncharacterized protein n=1 Tax=Melampsora larici-populina (strain 98AG31 / pathotype 3-4-7) TaxID=747676 RepID=F4RDB8_MELLP|nr:uncharacterized protein MELLADRAFT_104029 [Melampsora larici-populina 98AG31]EGG09636.1 hypothetical protein MELLADRAFT_104029 [Melampsora larici-populina 98AG31]
MWLVPGRELRIMRKDLWGKAGNHRGAVSFTLTSRFSLCISSLKAVPGLELILKTYCILSSISSLVAASPTEILSGIYLLQAILEPLGGKFVNLVLLCCSSIHLLNKMGSPLSAQNKSISSLANRLGVPGDAKFIFRQSSKDRAKGDHLEVYKIKSGTTVVVNEKDLSLVIAV